MEREALAAWPKPSAERSDRAPPAGNAVTYGLPDPAAHPYPCQVSRTDPGQVQSQVLSVQQSPRRGLEDSDWHGCPREGKHVLYSGVMSWVIAVWDGPRPASAVEARSILDGLETRREGAVSGEASSSRLVEYVNRLVQRWPDIDDVGGADSPWSDGPLLGNLRGSLFLCGIIASGIQDCLPYLIEQAADLGLVCFDPQTDDLYPCDGSLPPGLG